MKLTDGVQDAVKLAQNLHRQVKALKDSIDELILDEWAFADWEGEKNDKGRCKKGTATD